MNVVEAATYSTDEVAYLSGASLRQLRYWNGRGILRPSGAFLGGYGGSGPWWRWTPDDVRVASVLAALQNRHAGGDADHPVSRWRPVVETMRANPTADYLGVRLPDVWTFDTPEQAAAWVHTIPESVATIVTIPTLLPSSTIPH